MDQTSERFANRCLPLLMANQAGWCLLSAHTVRLTWNGGKGAADLEVELLEGPAPLPVVSHFGHGIATWNVPYLFRTGPGYNLLVRGPPNCPKDGASALEGLVEADWSVATFTMNWQLTRAGQSVTFVRGEPLCLLVPQRRGELESFQPELRRLDGASELGGSFARWSQSRVEFNANLHAPGATPAGQRWQKHYFQGQGVEGQAAREHQTKLSLRDFSERRAPAPLEEQLIVREDFLDRGTCEALIHAWRGTLSAHSDNGYSMSLAAREDPRLFATARLIVRELAALIAQAYGAKVGCDLALLCAIVPGFRHTLHADNARVRCLLHGDDAEQLRRFGCQCPNVLVEPNHTPWRRYTALLYLSGPHRGGDIVFGEGPNIYGGRFRRQIQVRPGLLVLSPSNEHFHHQTTPLESGVRHSLNCWFTDDTSRVAPEWA